jgi:DNA-binding CsgD family transcriptional regulator
MALIIPARALMAAWDGRFADAHRLLTGVLDRIVFDWDRAYMSAVCGIALILDGQRERGLSSIAAALQLASNQTPFMHAQRHQELAQLLCAAGEAIAGRGTNASRILNRTQGDAPVIEAMREAVVMLSRAVKNHALRDEVFERVQTLQTLGYGGIGKLVQAMAERRLVEEDAADTILTKTELSVLQALAEGRGPKDIALETGRSVYTIQAHIQNVIKKLGCSGRNEALTMARKRGLIG